MILPSPPKELKGSLSHFFEEKVDKRLPHPRFRETFEVGDLYPSRKQEFKRITVEEGSKTDQHPKRKSYKIIGVAQVKEYKNVSGVRMMKLNDDIPEIRKPTKYILE